MIHPWSIRQCVMYERNKTHSPISETTVFWSYRLHKHTVISTSTRTWKHSRFNNGVFVKKSILAFMEVHVKQDNFAIVINVCYKMLQQLSMSVKYNTRATIDMYKKEGVLHAKQRKDWKLYNLALYKMIKYYSRDSKLKRKWKCWTPPNENGIDPYSSVWSKIRAFINYYIRTLYNLNIVKLIIFNALHCILSFTMHFNVSSLALQKTKSKLIYKTA